MFLGTEKDAFNQIIKNKKKFNNATIMFTIDFAYVFVWWHVLT